MPNVSMCNSLYQLRETLHCATEFQLKGNEESIPQLYRNESPQGCSKQKRQHAVVPSEETNKKERRNTQKQAKGSQKGSHAEQASRMHVS